MFIKHQFKRSYFLHIGCLVEKVINHMVLIWIIKFNLKHVMQKSVKVCIIWKVVGYSEFYNFPDYKNSEVYGVIA